MLEITEVIDTTDFTKLIRGLFLTVMTPGMIIGIPLYNRERYIMHFVFQKVFLSSVNTHTVIKDSFNFLFKKL